jgi:hypothetical protein
VLLSHAVQHGPYGRAKQKQEFTKELHPVYNLSSFFWCKISPEYEKYKLKGNILLQYSLLWEKNHQILQKQIGF